MTMKDERTMEEKAREFLDDNTHQSERRKARKVRKRRRRRLVFATITLLFVTIIVGITALISTNVYKDEDEFKGYADKQLKDSIFVVDDEVEVTYEYGSPVSYAADYNVIDNKEITEFRDNRIRIIKNNFKNTKTAEEKVREKEEGKRLFYRPLEHALIVSSRIYETENGVISLSIYQQNNSESEKDMHTVTTKAETYQFSKETGRELIPYQVFNEDYKDICSYYFIDYFKKEYSGEDLNENWEEYVSTDETNFNKFVLTDTGATFVFDEGTVLKPEYGVVSAGIPAEIMGNVIRPVIKERYIDPTKPMVALTYDDGPGGKTEKIILDTLEKHGAVATFFYLGNKVSSDTKTVKRAYEMGCEIGNHTWNHPVLTSLTMKQVKSQIKKTNNAIKKACGAEPTVFRPSYGETNSKINKASNLPVIMWSVDTLDWDKRDAKKIFNGIKKDKNLDGDIILMHSIHDFTAKATKQIVPHLKKRGYQFVTVSELIEYKYGEKPKPGKEYR